MTETGLKTKALQQLRNFKTYWNVPPQGKFMSFKEVAAYSFGGIGASFVIQLGSTLLVSATNMIVGGAIGIAPTDMYVLYLIATLANIPLTALRANMIDNTRGKTGKYRPYLLSMGLPTAALASLYVWFPYEKLDAIFPQMLFGRSGGYIATCAVVLVFNLLLQFFYNFFNDAYTNLIHVLSPNTQERTDVLAVKSIVYSLAPSIMNMALPIIAKLAANNDLYDIRVYRISYPVFAVIGILLTIVVFANTREKIVQAKTHTIQISLRDALKEVSQNKYFWIIALAGWLGFLESSYFNILNWSYTYGHTCEGGTLALINTLVGNAALWGMLMAPFCIRRFGKKRVLIGMNFLNIVFILMMLIRLESIWWLFVCIYFNGMILAFEQITTPAIQADIRDYQQYKTGERIDGAFAAVATIGNLVTLATSFVLPAVEKHYGIYEGNGYARPFDILDVTTGEPGLFYKMLTALILMAAIGAFLNMVPYFFYDFTEKKQRSVVSVLKIRALFEDYANHALHQQQIVETIELIRNARTLAVETPKTPDKRHGRKQYRADLAYNEEIEIAQFVCAELDKFQTPLLQAQVRAYRAIYDAGLAGIASLDTAKTRAALQQARLLPTDTPAHKEQRRFEISLQKRELEAKRAYDKYFAGRRAFVQPDMEQLTARFDEEDAIDAEIFNLVRQQTAAKKNGQRETADAMAQRIAALQKRKKDAQRAQKQLMDDFATFNRAAKPFNEAKKLLQQQENYSRFDEIEALYDDAKTKTEQDAAAQMDASGEEDASCSV